VAGANYKLLPLWLGKKESDSYKHTSKKSTTATSFESSINLLTFSQSLLYRIKWGSSHTISA
jgi:hypothetical protein